MIIIIIIIICTLLYYMAWLVSDRNTTFLQLSDLVFTNRLRPIITKQLKGWKIAWEKFKELWEI